MDIQENNRLHHPLFFLGLVILLAIAASQVYASTEQASASMITVWGHVFDGETDRPIHGATIAVWEIAVSGETWARTPLVLSTTNEAGEYRLSFDGTFKKQYEEGSGVYSVFYRVYIYHNDSRTPGYDYIPMFNDVQASGDANVDFTLTPAASILVDGEMAFVDSDHPLELYVYTVVPENELPAGTIHEYGNLRYGAVVVHNRYLNLSDNAVIIPANTDLHIELHAFEWYGSDHLVIMDDPRFFLDQGELIHASLMQYTLPHNINVTTTHLDLTARQLTEAEQQGLYTVAERQNLQAIWALLEAAEDQFLAGAYTESSASLREAYLKSIQLDGAVQRLYADAAVSVYLNLFPIAFTATLLPYLFFDAWTTRLLSTGIVYGGFLAFFFSVYFGAKIVEFSTLLVASAGALLLTTGGGVVLARVFRHTLATVFTMARRNLMRRKIRFVLTLITITGIVTAFVSITSFTGEQGFVSQVIGTTGVEASALLLREPFIQPTSLSESTIIRTFTPMAMTDLPRLLGMADVRALAPKVENAPMESPFASVATTTQQLWLLGILGLSPHESEFTDFPHLVVEGRYLLIDDHDSVLISERAAKDLHVDVGSPLILDTGLSTVHLTVVGLLDDDKLGRIVDLDGTGMIPHKIVTNANGDYESKTVVPCDPAEVIVLDWETALSLPFAILQVSRVGVSVADTVDVLAFSRSLSLLHGYWVWAVESQKITFFGIAFTPVVRGLEIVVPWAIAIASVVITMLSAVHERRDEVVILSSVGLNPSHITYLFFAESLIIGLIGGGLGYLLGQGSYKLLDVLPGDVLVEQKVSAMWSLASFIVAITATVIGTSVALKFSTIITPSLLLRWSERGIGSFTGEPLRLEIPFRVRDGDLASMFTFIEQRFRGYLQSKGANVFSGTIRRSEDTSEMTKTLDFNYLLGERAIAGAFPFQLVARKTSGEEWYSLQVRCKGSEDIVNETVSFLRRSIMAWSAVRELNK